MDRKSGRVGEYQIESTIGRGGFGDVYLAKTETGEKVVVKQVTVVNNADQHFRERSYQVELKALTRVQEAEQRRDIVRMLDSDSERHTIVLEYLQDGDLYAWRYNNWAIDEMEDHMRLFSCQLLQAFLFLHSVSILHRDIKPQNILLRRSPIWTEKRAQTTLLAFEPVVADFGAAAVPGISSDTDFHEQSFQTFAGTQLFMAPEVKQTEAHGHNRRYSALSDVWSLGVLLLVVFVHQRSLNQNPSVLGLLAQYRQEMSPEFAQLLDGMLAVNPQQRMTWDQVAAHPWFKIPSQHAYDWLASQEALSQCELLLRPARSSNVLLSDDVSLSSSTGKALVSLMDAHDLALYHLKRLSSLHSEWTTDKPRFHARYIRPWDEKLAWIQQTLVAYEPLRQIATMRAIYKISLSYGASMASFSLLLEVGRVAMEKLKSFVNPTFSGSVRPAIQSEWQKLFEDTRGSLGMGHSITKGIDNEPENSPLRAFSTSEVPFYALMHTTCVLKFREHISHLPKLAYEPDPDQDLLSSEQIDLNEIIAHLHELILIMEHVKSTLPSSSNPMSTNMGQSFSSAAMAASSSQNSLSGSLSNSYAAPASHTSLLLTNEGICQDFIERLSTIIRHLPADVDAIKKSKQNF